MTKLPPPEQWVLRKMNEMEVAEMIEEHIDFYKETKIGDRPVHLSMQFVRHFMRRHDGVLPTVTAYATIPIALADGNLLAPEGLDRERGSSSSSRMSYARLSRRAATALRTE